MKRFLETASTVAQVSIFTLLVLSPYLAVGAFLLLLASGALCGLWLAVRP